MRYLQFLGIFSGVTALMANAQGLGGKCCPTVNNMCKGKHTVSDIFLIWLDGSVQTCCGYGTSRISNMLIIRMR